MILRHLASALVLVVALGAVAGCAIPARGPAVPSSYTERALPLGMSNARFFADGDPAPMIAEAALAIERERASLRAAGLSTKQMPAASFLAISGGGDNGAFGAGLINGWTTTGTRPEFNIVTGVSTGSLIAPFAFLGPTYDGTLRKVYTTLSPDRVFFRRRLITALFSDALADTTPLAETIARYADQAMFDAIAREYQKGRLLLISTTDLDAQRPVIWNIGAIAASRHPKSLDLFRKILLASAAIPGAFEPVLLDVEIDGAQFQEMHVDGGAIAQLFLYPASIDPSVLAVDRTQTAYIIRNARLDPEHAEIERRALTIAGRAINTMLAASGYNDVMRMYFITKRDGIDYNLAFIGTDFKVRHERFFDPVYMHALFDYGYRHAVAGNAWHKTPPGLHTTRARQQAAATK